MHDDEFDITVGLVRSLLARERPEWADLPIIEAGAGTDNRMFRVGDQLLARMPRTAARAGSLRKEQKWLPRLAPALSVQVPQPAHAGSPSAEFPAVWAVYRWIEGAAPDHRTIEDWPAFGADLARFVDELHSVDPLGAERAGDLDWYRGGSLRAADPFIRPWFEPCRAVIGVDLDVDTLKSWWQAALALPEPAAQVWLHGDLRPGNLIAQDGRLNAVIDFGGLSIRHPDAEHAPVWDLPAAARVAYWNALSLDSDTWLRARAWAIGVAVTGIPYYWNTFPKFVEECRSRLTRILGGHQPT